MKIHKTNAMRLLDQHKVTYQVRDYSKTGALSGLIFIFIYFISVICILLGSVMYVVENARTGLAVFHAMFTGVL